LITLNTSESESERVSSRRVTLEPTELQTSSTSVLLTSTVTLRLIGSVLQDGSFHYFKRSELELLAQLLPTSKWDRLRLPILIEITPEYGEGAAVIKDDVEAEVVAKLLGVDLRVPLIIYRPQISILRRRLPTATQYVFSLRILVEK